MDLKVSDFSVCHVVTPEKHGTFSSVLEESFPYENTAFMNAQLQLIDTQE